MQADDHDRLRLLRRLEEVLGVEEAALLMTQLPPVPWSELATKRDVQALEYRFDAMDQRFAGLQSSFAGLQSSVAGLQSSFAGLENRFAGLEHRFETLRSDLEHTVGSLDRRLGAVEHGLSTLQQEVGLRIERAFRQQLPYLFGLMIALVALTLAAVQFG